jgi:hypothetical protein
MIAQGFEGEFGPPPVLGGVLRRPAPVNDGPFLWYTEVVRRQRAGCSEGPNFKGFLACWGLPVGESLPLRYLTASCGKPNKTGHFLSHRIRTVENRGGDPDRGPRAAKLPPLRLPGKVESLEDRSVS